MALEGNLSAFGLSEILQLIAVQQKTGMLTVSSQESNAVMFFRDGSIISTRDRRRKAKDPFKEYLTRYGVLTREQLEACLRMLQLVSGAIANLAERNAQQAERIDAMRHTIDQLMSWRQRVIEQATAFMQAHLAEPIRLQDLAQHVVLSPSYFSQIFREETGQSPIDYLIDLRIERAKQLLGKLEANVTEAAGAVGYDSVSYFIRQFTARVGTTPGQWARHGPKPHE